MAERIDDIRFLSPGRLAYDAVRLVLEGTYPADRVRGRVPCYEFSIHRAAGDVRVGRIGFRVGETERVMQYVGHIGYRIVSAHRGHRYAAQACLALRPFVLRHVAEVVITCDPDNVASIRTIERIGAVFLNRVVVPRDCDLYVREGSTHKNRYLWDVGSDPGPGVCRSE